MRRWPGQPAPPRELKHDGHLGGRHHQGVSDDEDVEIPPELLEPPRGGFPLGPVATAEQLLPFGKLAWENFERLCLRLARVSGEELRRARLYGEGGQLQYGIDFYAALPSGRYASYQCKRIENVAPSDIKAAVDEFTKRPRWSRVSDRFVFCTSDRAVRSQLSDAIETQRQRLAKRVKPIEFEVWDAEELSLMLREHKELVGDFFGPEWSAAFFGTALESAPSAAALADELLARMPPRTLFVTNDWAPERLRERLESLRKNDPDMFERLNVLLGSPPENGLVRVAAKEPPEWLRNAGAVVWEVLARIAESRGEWSAASEAWERLAGAQDSSFQRAGSLVSAAIAAKMGDDEDRYDVLIGRAQEADAEHPRLVLERLPEQMPPAEQLEVIGKLHSDDLDDLAQIAARRALAELVTPDIAAARESIDEVKGRLPDSLMAGSLSISLVAQEARLAVMGHRPLDRAALLSAAAEADSVRDRLIEQLRWPESTRLLMLKADIYALLGERSQASSVLKDARAEERGTTEQKIVLASSAAERALDWKLAEEFLEGADETPEVARLHLEIKEAIGTPAEREQALAGLERMVKEGGPEAEHAAFVRLAATLGATPTPWSDEAADYLKQNGYERAAIQAEAFYRLRESGYEAGVQVLAPYQEENWALATLLRLALSPGAPRTAAIQAAERVLAKGTSHSGRVEAAQGFARGGNFLRAREVLVNVAREPGAPTAAQADAYEALMHVVGNELSEWDFAAELYGEWNTVAPTDSRAPKWAPRIANRRSRD
jgi:hypothetical protein